jgi:hypothetical protein
MGYRLLSEKLDVIYLLCKNLESFIGEEYAEDPKLSEMAKCLRNHTSDCMRVIGYTDPDIRK